MKDISQAKVLCPNCNEETIKGIEINQGFRLRFHQCKACKDKFYNSNDLQEFEEFKKIRQRQFNVKLRTVGNSFTVTIPREIIDFEERFKQIEHEMNQMMRLSLEEPGKVSLYFRKVISKDKLPEDENG